MSAVAPLPDPRDDAVVAIDGATAADGDGWAMLEAMRRRIDDQHAVVKTTQTQMSELAQSIAALVAEQRRRARRINLNSFVAYVIFTVLVGSAAVFLYRSRASELGAARDQAVAALAETQHRADDATSKLAARDRAEAAAWEIYELLENGKQADAKAKLAALHDVPFSRTERAALTATAHETQTSAADAALKAAVASFKAGHAADAIAPLEAVLPAEAAGPKKALMEYYLGVAFAKVSDLDKAVAHLETAVASEVDQEDARFQLASVLDRAAQWQKARTEYDRFATAHPQSPLAVYAMRRSATLAHMPPPGAVVAPVPPPQKPVAPPKPVAPAPVPAPPAGDPPAP